MADYILPFLNEAMDSSLVNIYVFRSKEIITDTLFLFPGLQGFISKGTTEGTGRVGNLMGPSLRNMGDAVRPGNQWIWGLHWSPSLCGCRVVVKEARPESRRRPSRKLAQFLHHGGLLAAVNARIDRFAGWEELIMNESAAAPPNVIIIKNIFPTKFGMETSF